MPAVGFMADITWNLPGALGEKTLEPVLRTGRYFVVSRGGLTP